MLLRVISMPRAIHACFRKTDSTVIKIQTGKENFKIIKVFQKSWFYLLELKPYKNDELFILF